MLEQIERQSRYELRKEMGFVAFTPIQGSAISPLPIPADTPLPCWQRWRR